MKHLIIFLLLTTVTTFISGQNITPSTDNEYCPNTEYSFSVTVPGTYQSITTEGGCIITEFPTGGSTFTFKAKFSDVNRAQSFKINYTLANGTTDNFRPVFKKVKSLFSGACSLIQTTSVTAPLCEIKTIPFSFTALQWKTELENPVLCFGSISTYEYLLPAGWKLNGKVSDGISWLQGNNNVNFTSDAASAGFIQVRAVNDDCGTPVSIYKGSTAFIQISRTFPTFTLSPTSVSIQCGTPLTQTFTVSMTGTTTCPVTYSWNLGDNNGWLYNGNPAPTTPFIAPASITLTSLAVAPSFANVTVTPLLNGIAQPALTAATGFQAPNLGLVGGSSSICTGTSSPFYLYNAPSGSSVYWGVVATLPNYGANVVQVDNPYSSSTTLTKINSGVVNLTVSATDACNQTYTRTRENILVGGYANTSTVTGYTLAYPPCYTQGCTPSPVSNSINADGPYGTMSYTGTAYLNTDNALTIYNSELSGGTWSLITGSVFHWSASSGTNLSFYPDGVSGSPVIFRLTNNNSCGTQYYDFTFYPAQYNTPYYYIVSPNPATTSLLLSVDETKLAKQNIIKSSKQDIKEITILDKMGTVVKKQTFGNGIRQVNLNVADLKTGYYILKIFNGNQYVSMKFMKE